MSVDLAEPLRPSRYLWGIFSTGISMVPIFLVVCSPALLLTYFAGEIYLGYAVLAVVGLIIYLTHLTASEETTTIADLVDSRAVQLAASVLIVLYYNTIILIAVFFGAVFEFSGTPALGVAVAMFYPTYDFEIADLYAPLSVAGAIVFLVAVVASLAIAIEQVVGWTKGRSTFSKIENWFESDESVRAAVLSGVRFVHSAIGRYRPRKPTIS